MKATHRISEPSAARVDFDFVHAAVREQAHFNPTALAVVDADDRRIDYRDLSLRSARLARRLRGLGIGPDDRVAVWLDRSIDLIVTMLAVMEAGGAYVPIDMAYPPERVAVMLKNAGAKVLITAFETPPVVADLGLAAVAPAAADAEIADAAEPAAALAPDHLAYVIHTSGSTGAPKGVAMSHRGLARLINWQIADGPRGLSTLQFTPVCFDVIFQEVFSTLCTGGVLWLVSDALRRDPERLLRTIARQSIERLFLPYVALQQLAKAATRTGVIPQTLKQVITAGERLIVTEAIADFFSALPDCRLDNHYGPTEAHLVTSFTLGDDIAAWPNFPPIGAAVGGVALYSLDRDLAPVPRGATAELYVGGEGLARCYLNAPDQTAERFLPDPFSPVPGARMYRTGDVVRIGADGVADFIGRADDQIKVRGFRIEPGDVERALVDHPRVRQAAVGLRFIAADVEALVGYVVADGAGVAGGELAKHLRAKLPDYMIPARFVLLDALPLTPSGKIDRRALNQIEIPVITAADSATSGALIDTIRAIWQRVLGHDELALADDFFDVGGDSLLATWVVTELSHALGREIELSLLLQDSTMAGLARNLDGMMLRPAAMARVSEIITLRAGPSQRALFLVHPLGGELLAYRGLARAIKSPLRVLGLRWQPPETESVAPTLLPEMAAVHLAQLRSIQPHGPYLLAGWSFGGVLAFELAQQIAAGGEQVEFLGLIDANPVRDPTTGGLTRESPLYERLTKMLREIDRTIEAGEAADMAQLLADPQLGALLGNIVPPGVTATHLRKNLGITRDSVWAAMNYRAVPYGGAIDLFQAEGTSASIRQTLVPELRRLAHGALRIHTVPGNHYEILRAPIVEKTARAVDDALEAIHGA